MSTRPRHTPVPGVRAYQRGASWWYRVELEPDPLTKERRFDRKGGFETEDAAWAAAVVVKRALTDGTRVPRSQRTVAAFFAEWFPTVRHELKSTTYQNYLDYAESYVLPAFGTKRMQDVDVQIINTFYRRLLESGRVKPDTNSVMYAFWKTERDAGREPGPTRIATECGVSIYAARKAVGRYRNNRIPTPKPPGLFRKTVKNVDIMLHRAFRDAVAWKYMAINPTEHASVPRNPTRGHQPTLSTWTPQEVNAWLRHAINDRYAAMWMLVATTGMRRSELAGVEIRLLDLDHSRLHIEDTRVVVAGKVEDSDGKTIRSRRTISLDPTTVKLLRHYLRRIRAEQAVTGDTYPTHDTLFRDIDGQPVHPENITRMFNRLVDKAHVSKIRLHDVRHSYATISIDNGIDPKIVSDRLGHASVAFTLDTYVHPTVGLDRDATNTIADLLFTDDATNPDDDPDDGTAGVPARRGR